MIHYAHRLFNPITQTGDWRTGQRILNLEKAIEVREWDKFAQERGIRLRVLVGEPFSPEQVPIDYFEDWYHPIFNAEGQEGIFWPDADPESGVGKIGWDNRDYEGYRKRLTMAGVQEWLFELVRTSQNLDWFFLVNDPREIRQVLRTIGRSQSRLRKWIYEWVHLGHVPRNVFFGTVTGWNAGETDSVEALIRFPCRRFLVCRWRMWVDLEAYLKEIDWVIIEGSQSLTEQVPLNPHCLSELVSVCRRCGVPVFFRGWGDCLPTSQYKPISDLNPLEEWRFTYSDGRTTRMGAIPNPNYVLILGDDSGRKLHGNEYLETPK